LAVTLPARGAAESLPLALANIRVDALHLHVEQLLHRLLDLRLGGGARYLEDHLVMLGRDGCLLGDHRGDDDVVMPRVGRGHLNRASSASTAALVSTSVRRRRMS